MRSTLKITFLIYFVFVGFSAKLIFASVENCGNAGHCDAHKIDKKILTILESEAPKGMFPNTTKVKFLGTVQNKHATYRIVFTSLVWGGAKHETARIVIFSSDWRYLGNYGEIYTPPTEIRGGVLYWPYSSDLGNKIELTGVSPPSKVILDGEIYYFDAEKQH